MLKNVQFGNKLLLLLLTPLLTTISLGSMLFARWPLIIDPSGQAATFLRYRDTNYIQALSPRQMEEEKIRLSVLGAIR